MLATRIYTGFTLDLRWQDEFTLDLRWIYVGNTDLHWIYVGFTFATRIYTGFTLDLRWQHGFTLDLRWIYVGNRDLQWIYVENGRSGTSSPKEKNLYPILLRNYIGTSTDTLGDHDHPPPTGA